MRGLLEKKEAISKWRANIEARRQTDRQTDRQTVASLRRRRRSDVGERRRRKKASRYHVSGMKRRRRRRREGKTTSQETTTLLLPLRERGRKKKEINICYYELKTNLMSFLSLFKPVCLYRSSRSLLVDRCKRQLAGCFVGETGRQAGRQETIFNFRFVKSIGFFFSLFLWLILKERRFFPQLPLSVLLIVAIARLG